MDGDFLQKLFEVLSQNLEKQNEPTAREQFRQLLVSAIQKAVSDMHDPVKKEEEYQQKLVEFLMKFIDQINGKDDDKKTALEDDKDENKEGLLLQLIDSLVKASQENAEEDKKEYTAAIYLYGSEIGLWTSDRSFEDGQAVDTESAIQPATAVKQVADVPQINMNEKNTDLSGIKTAEIKRALENGEPAVYKVGEKADYTENVTESAAHDFNKINDSSFNSETESGLVVNTAVNVENTVKVVAQNNGAVEAANAVNTEKIVIQVDSGKVQIEGAVETNAQNVTEVVQTVNQGAFENSGKGFQNGADKGKKSVVPVKLHFNRKVVGASEEMDELQRLFGGKNRDDEKMKEMNELKSESDENSEETKNTEKTVAVKEDNGLLKAYNGENKDESNNVFDKSVIEAVTIEALKADNVAVAKAYTPDENGAKQIMTQIISEMLNSLSHNGGTGRTVTTLTMTLNPESLGKITMKVSEEAGKISLFVAAHNKETAEILSQRMDAMQQAAKDSGTQLEKYQVVYAPGEDSRAGQQNYDGSSKNPYVRQDNGENHKDDNDGQFAELLRQAV